MESINYNIQKLDTLYLVLACADLRMLLAYACARNLPLSSYYYSSWILPILVVE